MAARVCVGRIGSPHGVRGLVTAASFTEVPEHLAAYGPVETEDGRRLDIAVRGAKKAGLIVSVAGVDSREAAAALKGALLYVPRDRLPQPDEEEWYHADLVGLQARDAMGAPLGRVVAVHDFGAGALLEIDPGVGETIMVPFTKENVPAIDTEAGTLVVMPPEETDAELGDKGDLAP